MRAIDRILSAGLLAATLAGLAPSASAIGPVDTRIVGGSLAQEGDWPWQAVLMLRTKSGFYPICGASVIDARWVLTAAHCVVGAAPADVRIGYGSARVGTMKKIGVAALVPHAGYDDRTKDNDIALIKLAAPATLPPAGYARLPALNGPETLAPGDNSVVTGFGTTEGDCGPDDFLRKGCRMQEDLHQVILPLVATVDCARRYAGNGATISERQLCAGLAAGGRDSCQGDSGGPLVKRDGDVWTQIGVVSWGAGCAQANLPGVYTRVAAYSGWIADKMGLNPVIAAAGGAAAGATVKTRLVALRAVRGGVWALGQDAEFDIDSKVSGYLLVLDINPAGKVTQLFPNLYTNGATPRSLVQGKTVRFPAPSDRFHLPVGEPLGQGRIVAVVTKKPLAPDLGRYGDLKPVADTQDFIERLLPILRDSPPITDPSAQGGTWTMGETTYTVTK